MGGGGGGGGGRCGASAVTKMMLKGSDKKRVRTAALTILSISFSLVITCCGQDLVSWPPPLGAFPSVANSTILFLHVFKVTCARVEFHC